MAEALLLSLSKDPYVPLCLTQGGERPEDTPLYDKEFTADVNLERRGAYAFAMFPVRDTPAAHIAADLVFAAAGSQAPELADSEIGEGWVPPVLEVQRPTLPSWLAEVADGPAFPVRDFGFKEVPLDRILALDFPPGVPLPSVSVQGKSGAVLVRWDGTADASTTASFVTSAQFQVVFQRLGVGPRLLTGGVGVHSARPMARGFALQIDRVGISGLGDEKKSYQKCSYGLLQPRVRVTGPISGPTGVTGQATHLLPVFGPGSEWLLRSCPDGPGQTPSSASGSLELAGEGDTLLSMTGRQISGQLPVVLEGSVRPRLRGAALDQAWDELAEVVGSARAEVTEAYEAQSIETGYLAAPIHCKQDHLYPIYRFTFRRRDHPSVPSNPIVVDVSVYGQGMARATEGWMCDPPLGG